MPRSFSPTSAWAHLRKIPCWCSYCPTGPTGAGRDPPSCSPTTARRCRAAAPHSPARGSRGSRGGPGWRVAWPLTLQGPAVHLWHAQQLGQERERRRGWGWGCSRRLHRASGRAPRSCACCVSNQGPRYVVSDVAGCIALTYACGRSWRGPRGRGRGRIAGTKHLMLAARCVLMLRCLLHAYHWSVCHTLSSSPTLHPPSHHLIHCFAGARS